MTTIAATLSFLLMLVLLIAVFAAVTREERGIYCIGVLLIMVGALLGGMAEPRFLGGLVATAGAVAIVGATVPMLRGPAVHD